MLRSVICFRFVVGKEMPREKRLESIYNFVRDDIPFGFNSREPISASDVLKDGFGQCNSKSTLFMALVRRAGIACRFHAFSISREIQKGMMPNALYQRLPLVLSPHSWVEVHLNDRWICLEGQIIDTALLRRIQKHFSSHQGKFQGYAIAVENLHDPPNLWTGDSTYIQRDAIIDDLGIFDSPDDFFATHPSNLAGFKGLLWRLFYYRKARIHVKRLRNTDW